MSDGKTTQDWMADWQALQQQFWAAWADATRSVAAEKPDAAQPWHEGLEPWLRWFGDSAQQSETAERLLGSAKNYLALIQTMLQAALRASSGEAAASWSESLRQGLGEALREDPLVKMLREIRGPAGEALDRLSASFEPFVAAVRREGLAWLNLPAFGYTREHQERYQKIALALDAYQNALQRYQALILKASQRSFVLLEDKLAEHDAPGRRIESLRALYDLWVDAAEQAYAEVASSDEFRQVYGDLVNAQMRVRSLIQKEVERIGVDLGMPTRAELNSVHRRLDELRRALRQRDDGAIADLRREVERLREQLDALRRAARAKPAAARAATRRSTKASKARS
jgi:hypothetical protein